MTEPKYFATHTDNESERERLSDRKRLFDPKQTLHAPHMIDVEVTQVLRRYAVSGESESERCRSALDDLADLPMTRCPHDLLLLRAWELCHNLTIYDAVYVARPRRSKLLC